jgi:hypothetical protein
MPISPQALHRFAEYPLRLASFTTESGTARQNRTLGAGRPSRDAARMTISRLYPGSNEPYLQPFSARSFSNNAS